MSAISVHKYHKSCSHIIWPSYALLQTETSENPYNRDFSAEVSQIVFLA